MQDQNRPNNIIHLRNEYRRHTVQHGDVLKPRKRWSARRRYNAARALVVAFAAGCSIGAVWVYVIH